MSRVDFPGNGILRISALAAKHVRGESKQEPCFANRYFLQLRTPRHVLFLEKNQVTDYLRGSQGLSAQRTKSRGLRGLLQEVGARRAPTLLVID